jgi:GxxExxY protein
MTAVGISGVRLGARDGANNNLAAGCRGYPRVMQETGRLVHGEITRKILVTFFEVYNELGTGFLESVYHTALSQALTAKGMGVAREVPIDVFFRQAVIGRFYADLVVDDRVIIELKAARTLAPEHHAQLLHYLRATAMEVGLLLNFGPRPQFQRLVFSNSLKHGLQGP